MYRLPRKLINRLLLNLSERIRNDDEDVSEIATAWTRLRWRLRLWETNKRRLRLWRRKRRGEMNVVDVERGTRVTFECAKPGIVWRTLLTHNRSASGKRATGNRPAIHGREVKTLSTSCLLTTVIRVSDHSTHCGVGLSGDALRTTKNWRVRDGRSRCS